MAINAITRPYPDPDFKREDRLVEDLAVMMHADSASAKANYKRWLRFVLDDANSRRKWWFLENVHLGTLDTGQDVIDIKGHFDKPTAMWAPCRLRNRSLGLITSLRMEAKSNDSPNAGDVQLYAIEGGRRIHLWPAPKEDGTPFALLYTRPMEIPLVPDDWESILLEGVIGRFGRHYDRSGLGERASEFERRYENGLKRARIFHHDIEENHPWDDWLSGTVTLDSDPNSADVDTATDKLLPASLTGIGYMTIDTGDYPLEVS